MFGFRSVPPAHVTMWMVVEYTDAGAALYRRTTHDIAVRAKMRCGAVKVDRATTTSKTRESKAVGIMLWALVIGAFSLAAVVNQIAIALCRRAQAATEPDLHEERSPEMQSGR